MPSATKNTTTSIWDEVAKRKFFIRISLQTKPYFFFVTSGISNEPDLSLSYDHNSTSKQFFFFQTRPKAATSSLRSPAFRSLISTLGDQSDISTMHSQSNETAFFYVSLSDVCERMKQRKGGRASYTPKLYQMSQRVIRTHSVFFMTRNQ